MNFIPDDWQVTDAMQPALRRETAGSKLALHRYLLLLLAYLLTSQIALAQQVTVLIGETTPAPKNIQPGELNVPFGVDFDSQGNMLVAEYTGGRVFRSEQPGELKLIAGTGQRGYSGDGQQATKATFRDIHNLAMMPNGDVFLSDHDNHVVRRIDSATGKIWTFAGTGKRGFSGDGGTADKAQFNLVMCVTLTPDRNTMLVADLQNHRIRSIDMQTNIVKTLAGNGRKGVPQDGEMATQSPLVDPRAAAMDEAGNLYIVERNGNALRVVRPTGLIETVAGTGKSGSKDGPALQGQLAGPKHLAITPDGIVYIADDLNHTIRKYDPDKQTLTTVLGHGEFKLKRPHGVTVRDKDLYVVDSYHHRILKMPLP